MRYLAFLLMLLSSVGYGATINVPGDYATIQEAIDNANNGDIVIVYPGTYCENIEFKGKAIAVNSKYGPDLTVIDGTQTSSVVYFGDGEGPNSVLEGFTITNGFRRHNPLAYMGGGILCDGSSPTIINNKIDGNNSYYGSGICCWGSSSKPLIRDCLITRNRALCPGVGSGRGGGICCGSSDAYITGCTIKENMCDDVGGGIGVDGICSPVIENCIIESNTAVSQGSGRGGGIGTTNGVAPIIRNNIIQNNKACVGAGMLIWGGEVSNNIIVYNSAVSGFPTNTGSHGGGIQTLGISSMYVIVKDNLIAYNDCLTAGGGLSWYAADGEVTGNIICYNVAAGGTFPGSLKEGGGICVGDHWCKGKFSNNVIYENYAEDCGGGVSIKWYQNVFISFSNTTITKNESYQGAGIYCHGSADLTITNSIVYDNIGPAVEYEQKIPEITYSDVEGDWPGIGNIDMDPCFVNKDKDDYHLLYYSPCKDMGDNNAPYLTEQDFEGDPRIAEGTVDIGADEFYKHLYYTGDATPDGDIDVKFVDIPGTAPIGLWVGTSVFEDPIHGSYGDWYLKPPFLFWGPFLPIPSPGGVFVISGNIPLSPAPPYTIYLQAIIGNKLTNLCEMKVTE